MTTQRTVINWGLVYLLLFLSGTWRYNLSHNKYLVLGFLVALIAWFLITDRKISDRFMLYAVVYFSFMVALFFYTGGGTTLASAVSGLMKLLVAYFILKTVGSSFVNIYIKLVVLLAVVSLFGYTSDKFYLFDGLVRKLPPVGEMGYEGILYLYRFPWHMERNNSIFFEPGAYQAFLNAALFLLAFAETSFENRTKLIFITILATTLVTTFSTTGFLIFAVIFPLFLYKSHVLTFTGKLTITGILFAVVAIFSVQFYSSFVSKVDRYVSAEDNEEDRKGDAMADLKIFRKHIFGIGYDQYAEEFSSARGVLLKAGSNGVTSTLAVHGLPFSLFLFGSFYWALKRLLDDWLLATAAFGMVMLFLAGETYYVATPITFSIIAAAFIFDRGSTKRESQHGSNDLPENPG